MSKFVVSARKYRPARFDDVVGQEHVSKTLKNALQNDQLAHAFLFCGPRGVGKTTCARILAKVINCQNITKDHEACDECSSCKAFNENASFNITELDAASNNSVEHIRALIEQVRFQPQQGKYKVFIIDEVHMLSQQAFNAFLKTLEEPPPYAIFILATTEKHKIIPTILSRCQIFDFRRIQVSSMMDHLRFICKEESIEAEEEALNIIAQKADGALRDALSIFDRMASSVTVDNRETGKMMRYSDVISNLNVLDFDYFFKIVESLLIEDLPNVLLTFSEIIKKGFEPDIFINGLAEHIRNLLVSKDEQTLSLLEVSESIANRYKEQARISNISFLLSALNIANDCDVNYKMARNKKLHVEMAIIKMSYINRAVNIAQQAHLTGSAPTQVSAKEKKTIDTRPITQVPDLKPKQENEISPTSQEKVERSALSASKPSTVNEPIGRNLGNGFSKSSKYDTPKLLSLDAQLKEIEKDESELIKEESRFSEKNLKLAWKAYTSKMTSPSGKSVFKKATLQIDPGKHKILIMVGTQMARSTIKNESELMPFLREELRVMDLSLRIKVDPSEAPLSNPNTKRKKVLTVKEKYEQLKELNPLLEEVRKRFDLKIDNDQ